MNLDLFRVRFDVKEHRIVWSVEAIDEGNLREILLEKSK